MAAHQARDLGVTQQDLGWDAADVEAGAAQRLALLDAGDLQPKLRGADGADIAAGAGADDGDVEFFHGRECRRLCMARGLRDPRLFVTRSA